GTRTAGQTAPRCPRHRKHGVDERRHWQDSRPASVPGTLCGTASIQNCQVEVGAVLAAIVAGPQQIAEMSASGPPAKRVPQTLRQHPVISQKEVGCRRAAGRGLGLSGRSPRQTQSTDSTSGALSASYARIPSAADSPSQYREQTQQQYFVEWISHLAALPRVRHVPEILQKNNRLGKRLTVRCNAVHRCPPRIDPEDRHRFSTSAACHVIPSPDCPGSKAWSTSPNTARKQLSLFMAGEPNDPA